MQIGGDFNDDTTHAFFMDVKSFPSSALSFKKIKSVASEQNFIITRTQKATSHYSRRVRLPSSYCFIHIQCLLPWCHNWIVSASKESLQKALSCAAINYEKSLLAVAGRKLIREKMKEDENKNCIKCRKAIKMWAGKR